MIFEEFGNYLKKQYEQIGVQTPSYHFVLGSGYAKAFEEIETSLGSWKLKGTIQFKDIPFVCKTRAPGHKGEFRYYEEEKTKMVKCFQLGRLHGYDGRSCEEVVMPVVGAFFSGVKSFVLSNAAGSLKKEYQAGSFLMITDHINFTGKNPLIDPLFQEHKKQHKNSGFIDMTEAYEKDLSSKIKRALSEEKIDVHEDVYLGLMGPSFETPAEIKTFNQWGAGAVGMSTVWETIVLRYLDARVCGVSFLSNMAAGMEGAILDPEEIIELSHSPVKKAIQAFFKFRE